MTAHLHLLAQGSPRLPTPFLPPSGWGSGPFALYAAAPSSSLPTPCSHSPPCPPSQPQGLPPPAGPQMRPLSELPTLPGRSPCSQLSTMPRAPLQPIQTEGLAP